MQQQIAEIHGVQRPQAFLIGGIQLAPAVVERPRLAARDPELLTVNLGTGRGYSVLEMIRAFEKASGRPIPYEIAPRRAGDVAACYADPARAKALLGWRAARSLEEMCADAWRWQSQNPQGFC